MASHDEFGPVLDGGEFYESVSGLLGIHEMMAREVMYYNDESDRSHEVPGPVKGRYQHSIYRDENPEERWHRMRRWVVSQLRGIP